MTNKLVSIARNLQRQQTDNERKLWARLRDRRLNGFKFRRQAPCGPFVADFLCEEALPIVDLDGSQHSEADNSLTDAARTERLNALGYEVFRIWNTDFKSNAAGVLNQIVDIATRRTKR